MEGKILGNALSFDDVLLLPGYSEVLPSEVNLESKLGRCVLKKPLISAAMDSVTESQMAVEIAQLGGLGVIHKNLPIEEQVFEVSKVKKSIVGMISKPVTVRPDDTITRVENLMSSYKISGLPVVDNDDKLVGILTNRDLRFADTNDHYVKDFMTSENLITVSYDVSMDDAAKKMHRYRIEKLLVVNEENRLEGLITMKDVKKKMKYPDASRDSKGRLLCAAAVGTSGDYLERCAELINENVDIIVIDTAHGLSSRVIKATKEIKSLYGGKIDLMVGNVATSEGVEVLYDSGADIVKIGMGPGSICTTRVIAGVGVPQFTAILNCSKVKEGKVSIVADGGIKYSGDATKAFAAGADAVMVGSLFAGTYEAPGEIVIFNGRNYKIYRGMGSLGSMNKGTGERYFQENAGKFVPEGVEGRVPYRGHLLEIFDQLIGGVCGGMGYVGAKDLKALQEKARFIKISSAGLRESHVHNVDITSEAPNYSRDF